MKSIKVALGGNTYTINEQPRKKNAAWREAFQNEFVDVAAAISSAADADITQTGTIADVVRGLMGQINNAVDALLPLLADYSPSIKADMNRIEEEAYESEIIDAFIEVLALAYPFGAALKAVSSLSSGLAAS